MKSKQSVFWGSILILIGVIFLGNNLDLWNVDIFFDGWWTLFIIVPSLYGVLKRDWGSLVSLILGVLLLLAAQDVIGWSMIWKIFVPLIIIMIGFNLIFNTKKVKVYKSSNNKSYDAVFGDIDEKIKEIDDDIKATSVFGDIDLDLRKAKVKRDIIIDCTTIFGDISLELPSNVKLIVNGVPIFGKIDNKHEEDIVSKNTIYINYTCIFGEVDII
ncbi:MAG: cell wall-active antibiotics response protein [Ruminococcus sp.]|nr:cell wall-active antibiotics response protein [Ruminococcus sp.]